MPKEKIVEGYPVIPDYTGWSRQEILENELMIAVENGDDNAAEYYEQQLKETA